jgi:hypothetical protein
MSQLRVIRNIFNLQMMDSRFGENSLLAVHFLKKSHAVVLPLNALYAQDLCEKVLYSKSFF